MPTHVENRFKLFVQAYCSCGVSVYVPIKSENVNQLTVDNTLRSAGWFKSSARLQNSNGVEEFWHCNKCRERNSVDPQDAL